LLLLLPFGDCYAQDVLTQIAERIDKAGITQGNFRQEKRLKVLKKPLISTGEFTYHQSKGVIWKTLTPVPSLLLVNETRLLTAQGEQAVPLAFGKVFKAMLGGDLSQLTEGFDITGSNRKPTWQLQLKPKDELLKKIIAGMRLSGDRELRVLEISEANGNLSRIAFDRITHPTELPPEQEADFARLSSPN
jgi:hypothetical protein